MALLQKLLAFEKQLVSRGPESLDTAHHPIDFNGIARNCKVKVRTPVRFDQHKGDGVE